MSRTSLALALTAALLLGACASNRSDTTPAAASAKPAEATMPAVPATAPVQVPAASARKVVLAMTGSRQVVEAKDWPAFKQEWRDTFGDYAKAAGIAFSFVDGDAKPQGEDGTLLAVHVNDYRMVGIAARIFLGIMIGNAYIDAEVRFLDLRDGTEFGQQKHNTSSSAWAGVFAKMTPQQVDAIGADVFKDLKAAR